MADASYDVQHLALQAAGFISSDGVTVTTFGCQMTRSTTGTYAMILGDNNGVIDNESFEAATCKSSVRNVVATDTSNTIKTFLTFNELGSLADTGIEVALWKTVTH
jgi:hypothetical protein